MSLIILAFRAAVSAAFLAAVFLAIAALIELFFPGCIPRFLNNLISYTIDSYLRYTQPIKHRDGSHELPTCPYVWPNGQGDAAKFLGGVENSAMWKEKYGNIYRIWSGMKAEIVFTQPHHLQPVFRDSNKHIKASANDSGAYMRRLLGSCVGLISGREWQAVRAVVEVPFAHSLIPGRVVDVDRLVREHFAELNSDKNGPLSRGILHPAEDMKMLPFWVVCEVFYGRLSVPLKQKLRDLAPLREQLFRHVLNGGIARYGWSQWLPTVANAEMNEFQTRWKAFNDEVYADALSHNPKLPIVDMYRAVADGTMSLDQMLQTLDESLYANLDVTTGGLSWNLLFLAAHPDVQSRLRDEASLALKEDRFSHYVQSESTFLASCVLESSRLKPLAAFSVPQAAPTAREVDGYMIPAGTNFVVDSYALNIHSDTWAPDNTSYRPDRFFEKKNTELRYRFWRFGFGPRQCMGRYVADLAIRQTLAHLVLEYELGWLDGKEAWARNEKSWITHPNFPLRCEKRVGRENIKETETAEEKEKDEKKETVKIEVTEIVERNEVVEGKGIIQLQ